MIVSISVIYPDGNSRIENIEVKSLTVSIAHLGVGLHSEGGKPSDGPTIYTTFVAGLDGITLARDGDVLVALETPQKLSR